MEDFRNLKEKVQDMVSGLEDLTEKERKDVLSCLTKCLTKDQELQDLGQRMRGPRRKWGREREEPVGRAVGAICYSGTSDHLPRLLALGV